MITTFIADKMSAYVTGGMKPETAARFARGELGAIYRRNHYSRDNSGVMRLTPLPENILMEAARAKCNEAINEILDYCAGVTSTGSAPMGTVTKIEKPSGNGKKNGLEGLKNYVNRKPA